MGDGFYDVFERIVKIKRYTEKQKKRVSKLKSSKKLKLKTFKKRKQKLDKFRTEHQKIIDKFFILKDLVNKSEKQIDDIDWKLLEIKQENTVTNYVPTK